MRTCFGRRPRVAGLTPLAALVVTAGLMLWPAAAGAAGTPVSGAGFTTVNETIDGPNHCKNGNPAVNCNIYDGKQYVWLNGGPATAYVGDGSYFFAVLTPGGQADPNDGAAKNLSDDFDAYTDRSYTVSGGAVSYAGPHDVDSNKIRLAPYADTANPGGVYILAICSLRGGYPVNPNDCKYDAFKVEEAEAPDAVAPAIVKDASGSYTNTYAWTIAKDVDKTLVKQIGGTAAFTYTVTVGHDGGTVSNVRVTGEITVSNLNEDASDAVVPVAIDGVADELSDGTGCDVDGGGAQTLTQADTSFSYTCSLTALPQTELHNTATVTWSDQFLDNGAFLAGGKASITFPSIDLPGITFAGTTVDECVDVTDTNVVAGLGTVCVGGTNPRVFTYPVAIAVGSGCQSYNNTAAFTTTDTGATGNASKTVTVCGPVKTGALTIGFWKNTNGQGLIGTYCGSATTGLGAFLGGLGAGAGPFAGAPTGCAALKTYLTNILSGASATDMNRMLKAQMLASALDVWFSGPGWTSTTVNKVKPPSAFLSHNSLGTFAFDTTAVCPMVDNLSTGTASCKNALPSTDGVAAGAVPTSPMTMSGLLAFASTAGTAPWTTGAFTGTAAASTWYGSDRTKQEVLKNIFDQFDNQLAFGSF